MRTVAVILDDNDFGHTFMPLMETLRSALAERPLTEEQVCQVIREGALFHYMAFQYSFRPQDYFGDKEDHLQYMKKYLVPHQILFDAAADTDILTGDHDGGAWYLELQSGQIGAY